MFCGVVWKRSAICCWVSQMVSSSNRHSIHPKNCHLIIFPSTVDFGNPLPGKKD
jgi:hypothetical protein